MRKLSIIAKFYPLLIVLSAPWPYALLAQDVPPSQAQDPIDEKLKPMLDQVQQMTVRIPSGAESKTAMLNLKPLISYSDQERALPDSTLWMWHHDDVPVLFCKVEGLTTPGRDGRAWQFCCVPATEQLLDVEWNREFRWRAKEAGFGWVTLADQSAPAAKPPGRLTQLKGFARQFSADIENARTKDREEMRLLTHPLYRYSAPAKQVVDGAVFGLTSNGTNPDALLLIEATSQPGTDSHWRYAVVGMSGDAVQVNHADKTIWTKPFTSGPGDHRSWMWYVSRED
jgi:hypothetical protein